MPFKVGESYLGKKKEASVNNVHEKCEEDDNYSPFYPAW